MNKRLREYFHTIGREELLTIRRALMNQSGVLAMDCYDQVLLVTIAQAQEAAEH